MQISKTVRLCQGTFASSAMQASACHICVMTGFLQNQENASHDDTIVITIDMSLLSRYCRHRVLFPRISHPLELWCHLIALSSFPEAIRAAENVGRHCFTSVYHFMQLFDANCHFQTLI
jgi:hypothetical protein